jgi:sugar phosphate isomerase/epimerase
MKRFLCTLLSLSVGAFAVDFSGDFKGPAGLQLYSLRESFKTDVPGTLDKVKALGIREVETASTYGLGPEKFKAMLEERGLKPVSGHFQYEALKKDTAAAVKEAQALGLKFAVCPWIPHEIGSFGEADVQRAAADFNTFGAAFKAAGIQFAYHPHGYEFRPVVEGGTETLFDRMVKTTDANVVSFEMDVFWVVHPGQDPAKAPLTDDVPLGTGQVDWPTVLKAAAKAGVKHYFIEDESPTVADALPVTLKYLQTVKF